MKSCSYGLWFAGLLAVLLTCSSAFAGPFRRSSGSVYQAAPAGADLSTAQGAANAMAAAGRMAHFGGNPGYEGVAFSTTSADDAITRCCYWGTMPVAEIGVARGAAGWYACVRYGSPAAQSVVVPREIAPVSFAESVALAAADQPPRLEIVIPSQSVSEPQTVSPAQTRTDCERGFCPLPARSVTAGVHVAVESTADSCGTNVATSRLIGRVVRKSLRGFCGRGLLGRCR